MNSSDQPAESSCLVLKRPLLDKPNASAPHLNYDLNFDSLITENDQANQTPPTSTAAEVLDDKGFASDCTISTDATDKDSDDGHSSHNRQTARVDSGFVIIDLALHLSALSIFVQCSTCKVNKLDSRLIFVCGFI